MTISVKLSPLIRLVNPIPIFFEKDPGMYIELWSDGLIFLEFQIGDYWWTLDGEVRVEVQRN